MPNPPLEDENLALTRFLEKFSRGPTDHPIQLSSQTHTNDSHTM